MIKKIFYELVCLVVIVSISTLTFLGYFRNYFFSDLSVDYNYIEYDKTTLITYFTYIPFLIFVSYCVYFIRSAKGNYKNSVVNTFLMLSNFLIIGVLLLMMFYRKEVNILSKGGESYWVDFKKIFDLSIYMLAVFIAITLYLMRKIYFIKNKGLAKE